MAPLPSTSDIKKEGYFRFLDLPIELQIKICKMATTFEQRILPEIWLMPAWNTFVHGMSLSNIRNLHHWDLPSDANDIPDVLAAENLAATCKALRRLIMGTELLFYKFNTFHFYGAWTMSAYMTAITPTKRNAIRSIRLIVDGPPKNHSQEFTTL